jgi:transposase
LLVAKVPPYSPDLNPIGNAIAKLKALLRKAAERSFGEQLEAERGTAMAPTATWSI